MKRQNIYKAIGWTDYMVISNHLLENNKGLFLDI